MQQLKPHLLIAIHNWCEENYFTNYLLVHVDGNTKVPNEYVKDNIIILNISEKAASKLEINNDFVYFEARFNGIVREIYIPIERIASSYAKENSNGMSFEILPSKKNEEKPIEKKAEVIPFLKVIK